MMKSRILLLVVAFAVAMTLMADAGKVGGYTWTFRISGATFKGWWTAPVSGGSMQYDANGKFVPNSTCWDANGKWKHHGNATLYAR